MGAVYDQLSITERRKIERWRHAKVPCGVAFAGTCINWQIADQADLDDTGGNGR
jgi:hypothetical protein